MRLTNIVSSVLLLAAATSAWPAGWDFSDNIKREIAPFLEIRADKTTTAAKSQATASGSSSASPKSTQKNTNSQASSSASGSATTTGKGGKTTGKTTGKSTGKATTKYESTKTFDDRLPAGGVSMVTPGPFAGPQYYKIEDWVTFAWNYTSLSITPSAVDILASCSLNQQTYTIALNQTVAGPTQTILWDTGNYSPSVPLVVATYTLVVYDAASSPDATARAGYLAPYDQFTFGMYTPQAGGKDFQNYVCATCNGAGSLEAHTVKFLLGMVAMTVLSFGWFAGVAGLW